MFSTSNVVIVGDRTLLNCCKQCRRELAGNSAFSTAAAMENFSRKSFRR